MKNLIIGSLNEGAGKTSFIVGLGKVLQEKFGYLKPFGDRLIYRRKRLWDYDSALITGIFGLEQNSEEMTIGFEHSKLRYMYDENSTKTRLQEMMHNLEANTPLLFIEGGKDLTYGTSIHLDTLSLAGYIGGKLILVIAGDSSTIIDDITFVKRYIDMTATDFGIIINKVSNLEDYRETHLQDIRDLGVDVLGIIPYVQDLTYVPVSYIAEKLQARVIAGEGGLARRVKNIFVGAMSVDSATRLPLFRLENKLAITGGDRSDMIVAALESNTSGIILTANIIPPQNIIAKAADKNIPLLLVPFDTFRTAKQIDDMTPLLTMDDSERVSLLQQLVERHVDITRIV